MNAVDSGASCDKKSKTARAQSPVEICLLYYENFDIVLNST